MTYGLAMSLQRPQAVQCRLTKSAGTKLVRKGVTLPSGARASSADRVHTRQVFRPSAWGIPSRYASISSISGPRPGSSETSIGFALRQVPAQAHVNHVGVTVPSVRCRTGKRIDKHDYPIFADRFAVGVHTRSQHRIADAVSFAGVRPSPHDVPAIRGCDQSPLASQPRLIPPAPDHSREGASE